MLKTKKKNEDTKPEDDAKAKSNGTDSDAKAKTNGAADKPPLGEEAADALKDSLPDMEFSFEAELKRMVQTVKEHEGKRGAPPKEVVIARDGISWAQILGPTLQNVNRLLVKRIGPEFAYTGEEIQMISLLGGKVLAKNVSPALDEYSEEVQLAIYLASGLIERVDSYRRNQIARAQSEAATAESIQSGPGPEPGVSDGPDFDASEIKAESPDDEDE